MSVVIAASAFLFEWSFNTVKRKNIKPSAGYWMIYLLPALFIYIVFMAYPLIDSLRLSFYSGNPTGEKSFVGLENFIKLFADLDYSVRYWGAFKNTCFFSNSYVGPKLSGYYICSATYK